MRTNQQRPSGYTSIALFLGVLLMVAVIGILLSSAMERGGWMFIGFIAGLIILAALSAWLTSFIVRQYVTWTETRVKSRDAQNNFTLNLLKAGYQPDGFGGFKPVEQITAPAPQAQLRSKVYDFNPNDIHTASVNYLLYSIALLGENGNRLASAPECAAATNLANYSARSWDRIVKHLSAAYDVVTQPGPIQNGGGVYVPESIGSVGKLYHHILLNSAVANIPENKRAR